MTAVYVVQRAYDDPEYYDTEREALSRQRELDGARPSTGRIETVVYRIDVEPAPRGGDYWNRTSRGAAA